MKNLTELDGYRRRDLEIWFAKKVDCEMGPPELGGFFVVPQPRGPHLKIIAGSGEGWDHVSVSPIERKRCPTWEEMEFVKRLFFKPDETAMQLHVPTSDHISHHPYCLHIWRPHDSLIPLPPSWMVA